MKTPRQKKSSMYYYFWSVPWHITVFFGQLYVGYWIPSSCMDSMLDLMDKVDGVLLHTTPDKGPNFL